jgi:hypothetical protein
MDGTMDGWMDEKPSKYLKIMRFSHCPEIMKICQNI